MARACFLVCVLLGYASIFAAPLSALLFLRPINGRDLYLPLLKNLSLQAQPT